MRLIILAAAVLAAGCAAQSGVVDMGAGNYFVSRQAATGFPGMGNLRAEALREAADTCRAQNKAIAIVEEHQTQPPYLLGNYPRIDLTFRCE
jgi:hypothetical protein